MRPGAGGGGGGGPSDEVCLLADGSLGGSRGIL